MFERLKKLFVPERHRVRSPSAEYPTAIDAVRSLLRVLDEKHRGGDSWATIHVETPEGSRMIQVTGKEVNLLLEQVDMHQILIDRGLVSLVPRIYAVKPCLWQFDDATPEELTQVVMAVLELHFKARGTDPLEGEIEC